MKYEKKKNEKKMKSTWYNEWKRIEKKIREHR